MAIGTSIQSKNDTPLHALNLLAQRLLNELKNRFLREKATSVVQIKKIYQDFVKMMNPETLSELKDTESFKFIVNFKLHERNTYWKFDGSFYAEAEKQGEFGKEHVDSAKSIMKSLVELGRKKKEIKLQYPSFQIPGELITAIRKEVAQKYSKMAAFFENKLCEFLEIDVKEKIGEYDLKLRATTNPGTFKTVCEICQILLCAEKRLTAYRVCNLQIYP